MRARGVLGFELMELEFRSDSQLNLSSVIPNYTL